MNLVTSFCKLLICTKPGLKFPVLTLHTSCFLFAIDLQKLQTLANMLFQFNPLAYYISILRLCSIAAIPKTL